MNVHADLVESPVARFLIAVGGEGELVFLEFVGRRTVEELVSRIERTGATVRWNPMRCRAVRMQLDEYFGGRRREFDLKLAPKGTPFQRKVWNDLLEIPFGQTISYGELARRIDSPGASRAVGRANGANPISLVIPCHRVIGADGTLTGYGGGLAAKRALLDFERGQSTLTPRRPSRERLGDLENVAAAGQEKP